jgi:hypothetical protein
VGPQIGHLLGWPVFATSSISTTEAVGSGSNQSHIVLANAHCSIHIAQSGEIELMVSKGDFGFDSAQIGIMASHKVSFGYQPAASICVLQGIN